MFIRKGILGNLVREKQLGKIEQKKKWVGKDNVSKVDWVECYLI